MSRVGRNSEKFALRLPDGLRNHLKEMADSNRRSMNSEIVALIERAAFGKTETQKADAQA